MINHESMTSSCLSSLMLATLLVIAGSISTAQETPSHPTDDRLKTAPFATIKPRSTPNRKSLLYKSNATATQQRSAAPADTEKIKALERNLERVNRIRRALETRGDELDDAAAESRLRARLVADDAVIERGNPRFVSMRESEYPTLDDWASSGATQRDPTDREIRLLAPVSTYSSHGVLSNGSPLQRLTFERERPPLPEGFEWYCENDDIRLMCIDQDPDETTSETHSHNYLHLSCDCAECHD